MSTRTKLSILAVVFALGLCAALPFRKPAEKFAPAQAERTSSASSLGREVPLVVTQSNDSPAATLYDSDRPATNPATTNDPPLVKRQPVLEPPGTPPSLPEKFEPLLPPLEGMLGPHWARAMPGRTTIALEASTARPTVSSDETRHIVADGDTLSTLAARYLGSSSRRLEIFEANRGRLANPDVLPIGAELIIPARESPAAELLPVPGQ